MKKYNDEEIVISLTTWKKRVATTYKTIDSLLKYCDYCHIVVVLATEEFPNKEHDLPSTLMTYVVNNKIELLWVDKNYLTYKKSVFTATKYKNAIIVTADDDKIYTEDFVAELYKYWLTNKNAIVTYRSSVMPRYNYKCTCNQYGEATLFPPNYYGDIAVKIVTDPRFYECIVAHPNDDIFHTALRSYLNKSDYIVIDRNHLEISESHDDSAAVTTRNYLNGKTPGTEEYNRLCWLMCDESDQQASEIEECIKKVMQ